MCLYEYLCVCVYLHFFVFVFVCLCVVCINVFFLYVSSFVREGTSPTLARMQQRSPLPGFEHAFPEEDLIEVDEETVVNTKKSFQGTRWHSFLPCPSPSWDECVTASFFSFSFVRTRMWRMIVLLLFKMAPLLFGMLLPDYVILCVNMLYDGHVFYHAFPLRDLLSTFYSDFLTVNALCILIFVFPLWYLNLVQTIFHVPHLHPEGPRSLL